MSLKSKIDKEFSKILGNQGFTRCKGPWLSYVKEEPGNRILHVDIVNLSYMNSFSVSLQDLSCDGSRRSIVLEDFEGLNQYEYGNLSKENIADSVRLATKHLLQYGLPWFSGEKITTPALKKLEMLSQNGYFEDYIKNARQYFKKGEFQNSVELFLKAKKIKSLDAVSSKFLEIALKKLGK